MSVLNDLGYEREQLMAFLETCIRGDIFGNPSVALDQVWHDWLESDESDYERVCKARLGVVVDHVPAEASLDSYLSARSAVNQYLDEPLDLRLWPELVRSNKSDLKYVGDCSPSAPSPPDRPH